MLGDVAVGQVDVREDELRSVIDLPAHYRHDGRVTQGLEVPLEVQLDLSLVIGVVTRLAQCDEVVGRVASREP